METKIAILRGINVGGKRKILMDDLKALLSKLGFKDVSTYIQSGNVIFKAAAPNAVLESTISNAITNAFGFEVPVIVRSSGEVQDLINGNPFSQENADIIKLHLTFLKEIPSEVLLANFASINHEPDRFKIDGKAAFIYCENKYHESKLTNNFFEKKLKVQATTRNWKTVLKLAELSKE